MTEDLLELKRSLTLTLATLHTVQHDYKLRDGRISSSVAMTIQNATETLKLINKKFN